MIDARFVYMERPEKCGMVRSDFSSKYSQTLDLLEAELRHLRAKEVTVQAGYRQVRNDGWPYSAAKPEHPAVALQYSTANSRFVFRAFRYTRFEDNLRAIAKTLESLRGIDRWGVVEGQQYSGFKQIEAPTAEGKMTREAAAAWLAFFSNVSSEELLGSPGKLDQAFREARIKLHPDRQESGSHEALVKTQLAYDLLKGKVSR